jgi:serine/threonine protein kinase
LCSKYQKIYALWDYPKTTLADDINMRSLQKTPFTPYELRSLIAQIAQGLGALQKHKISHESINTKTILLE